MDFSLTVAGQVVDDVVDTIRRYCGLSWSGGPPETFEFRYFDVLPTLPHLEPSDVLVAAAFYAGLSRRDLAFYEDHMSALESWLAELPINTPLAALNAAGQARLCELSERCGEYWQLRVISPVLHRKRPELIPLMHRSTLKWYGIRGEDVSESWKLLVTQLQEDLCDDQNRRSLMEVREELRRELGSNTPTDLRMLDIAISMATRPDVAR